MPRIVLVAGLGACLALGAIALFLDDPTTPSTGYGAGAGAAPATERLLALESALDEERQARQLLEEELFRLIDEVERLKEGEARVDTGRTAESRAAPAEAAEVRNRFAGRAGRSSESRTAELVAGGLSPDRAATIARREAELRMQAMRARFEFETGHSDVPIDSVVAQLDVDGMLREELSEAEYGQYLEASNRSTFVGINDVLEFSPAEQAGLRAGDRIVRYNGERVYNLRDLNRQQMQAGVGSNVVVDILRDGVPMQVTVPRGPLGVMAGRGR